MPLTEKQSEYLMHCNRRWNFKTGATGSGKSYLDIAVTIPKRILASRGEGLLVLFGNTRGTLERNIIEPMRDLWPNLIGQIRSDNTIPMFGKKVYVLGQTIKSMWRGYKGQALSTLMVTRSQPGVKMCSPC